MIKFLRKLFRMPPRVMLGGTANLIVIRTEETNEIVWERPEYIAFTCPSAPCGGIHVVKAEKYDPHEQLFDMNNEDHMAMVRYLSEQKSKS